MKNRTTLALLLITQVVIAQNIGIGTSNPAFKLHVVNNNSNSGIACFQSGGGIGMILAGNGGMFADLGVNDSYGYCGTSSPQDFSIRTGSTNRMYISHSTGHIGIGTTNPEELLHVNGNTRLIGNLGINTNNSFARFQLYEDSGTADLAYFEATGGDRRINLTNGVQSVMLGANETYTYVGSEIANDFAIHTEGVPKIIVKHTSGNFGIGTTNPIQKLHVSGTSYFDGMAGIGTSNPIAKLDVQGFLDNEIARFQNITMDQARISVTNGNGLVDFGMNNDGGFVGTVTAGNFRIRTNYSVRMFFRNSDGFVGIGTELPAQKLDVDGNINLSGNIIVEAPTNATLLNGWVVYDNAFGTPQYSKDKQGRVLLSGLAEHTPVIGGHVFTLPVGYRPEKSMYFLAASDHPNGYNKILINHTNGEVSVVNTGSNITWVSFDNVIFRGN